MNDIDYFSNMLVDSCIQKTSLLKDRIIAQKDNEILNLNIDNPRWNKNYWGDIGVNNKMEIFRYTDQWIKIDKR